jgi:drug/metabolite transporter (DMT)-like permease
VHYFLALASAALYGAADFLGGLASRRTSTIAVVIVSQAAGLLPLALLLVVLPGAPTGSDVLWGAVAGLAGSTGVGLLYRALAIGTMSIVAPTTAVCAVMLPVLAELWRGERLGTMTIGGIALAVAAIVLVSQPPRASRSGAHTAPDHRKWPRSLPAGMGLALLSGVAIGLFFLALARTAMTAGLWPLLFSRALSIVVFTGIALAGSHPIAMPRPALTLAGACGVVDMLANALYLIASRGGPLSVVVTLASLYPASTVILARIVVGERLGTLQNVGIVCALAAVVLIVS